MKPVGAGGGTDLSGISCPLEPWGPATAVPGEEVLEDGLEVVVEEVGEVVVE